MKPYGIPDKRKYKIHPANECKICSNEETEPNKRRERMKAKNKIKEELNDRSI